MRSRLEQTRMNKKWELVLVAVGAVAVVAQDCNNPQPPNAAREVYSVPVEQPEGARFSISSHGKFKAGYENNEREILIITDNETKHTYLGITGVGITELHAEREGKAPVTRER